MTASESLTLSCSWCIGPTEMCVTDEVDMGRVKVVVITCFRCKHSVTSNYLIANLDQEWLKSLPRVKFAPGVVK